MTIAEFNLRVEGYYRQEHYHAWLTGMFVGTSFGDKYPTWEEIRISLEGDQ